MRSCLIGGAGLIGSYLSPLLLSSSREVVNLDPRVRVSRLPFASSGGTVCGPGTRESIPKTAATRPISPYGMADRFCVLCLAPRKQAYFQIRTQFPPLLEQAAWQKDMT